MSKWRNFHCEDHDMCERVLGWCINGEGGGRVVLMVRAIGGWCTECGEDVYPALWQPLPDEPYVNDTRGQGGPKYD